MPAPRPFSYAVLRVVPCLERDERLNVGVVVFARQRGYLDLRTQLDPDRLAALAPQLDPAVVRDGLAALASVVRGEPGAGRLAILPESERFGWIVAPSSTMIQPSAVHTGLTDDPQATLERLFHRLVTV